MTSIDAETRCTPSEYLARERENEYRSEYIDGWMCAMPANNRWHGQIVMALVVEIGRAIRDLPCLTFALAMRVKVAATGMYAYPDIVTVCGQPVFEDRQQDTLLNPSLVLEVLSDQTERRDRGEKFLQYRRSDSLREYILISHRSPRVDQYIRDGDLWILKPIEGLDATVSFETLGCTLTLARIYEGVELPEPSLR